MCFESKPLDEIKAFFLCDSKSICEPRHTKLTRMWCGAQAAKKLISYLRLIIIIWLLCNQFTFFIALVVSRLRFFRPLAMLREFDYSKAIVEVACFLAHLCESEKERERVETMETVLATNLLFMYQKYEAKESTKKQAEKKLNSNLPAPWIMAHIR